MANNIIKNSPPYFKQNYQYACSLAVLRMVLATYGINISEEELLSRVKSDYGQDFKNIWNPTIAKIAREYKIKTTMFAEWLIFKKDIYIKALAEFKEDSEHMNYKKYENPKDNDDLIEPLPLAYKEMFNALELGCRCVYGKLTANRIRSLLLQGNLIQTSIKLHILYPDKKHVFHSILIYKIDANKIDYHDPAHGESLTCDINKLIKASNNVGAAIVYSGLDK
jgi:hypothetical protein